MTIYRDIAIERTTDIQQGGPFSSTSWNDEQDKTYLIMQELENKIGRAIRFPLTAGITNAQAELAPLSSYAGKFLHITDAGLLEPAELTDDLASITKSGIGELLYPDDYTGGSPETDALVTDRITDRSFPIGDAYRYGYDPDASDNRVPIQDAINVCAHANLEFKLPGGEIKCGASLYGHYHSTLNPGYPSATRNTGRTGIVGQGVSSLQNILNSEYLGSVLHFTAADTGLIIGDGTDTTGRALKLENFTIVHSTTDTTGATWGLYVRYMPQSVSIKRLTTFNLTGGQTAKFVDLWIGSVEDIDGYGLAGAGVRVWFDAEVAGGGDMLVRNVNGYGPVAAPASGSVGLQFGDAFDAARTAFIKNWTVINSQGKGCEINGWLRAGVGQMTLIDCWEEGHGDAGNDFSVGWRLSDKAGFQDMLAGDYVNPGLLRFIGGVLSSTDTTAGNKHFEIGQDTGDDDQDAVGNVIFDAPVLNQLGSNNIGFYLHNVAGNGERRITLILHNNSGLPVRLSDEAQYGAVHLDVLDPDGIASTNLVKDDVGGTVTAHWLGKVSGIIPVASNDTFDYSDAVWLPSHMSLRLNDGATTITLPSAPKDQTVTWYVPDEDANALTIDPGSTNLNGSTADKVISDRICHINLSYKTSGAGWVMSVARRIDETVHRLPTSTTAALEAVGNAINTSAQKVAGACVFNTTTGAPVWASGNADDDTWLDATGSTAHSPV